MSYANGRIRGKEEMQRADVRWWKWQASWVVGCAGTRMKSDEAALFPGVVLVQLGLCAKMIDDVL